MINEPLLFLATEGVKVELPGGYLWDPAKEEGGSSRRANREGQNAKQNREEKTETITKLYTCAFLWLFYCYQQNALAIRNLARSTACSPLSSVLLLQGQSAFSNKIRISPHFQKNAACHRHPSP